MKTPADMVLELTLPYWADRAVWRLDVAVALTTGIPLCAHQSKDDTESWEERVRDHPLWQLATEAVRAELIRTDYESSNPEVTPRDFLKWRISVTCIPMPEEALRCFARLLPDEKEDASDKALQHHQKLGLDTGAGALRTAKITAVLAAILMFLTFGLMIHCATDADALRTTKIAAILVGILLFLTFELVIHRTLRWDWLLSHPNSYGLQGCFFFMTEFGIVGLCVEPWRNALWVTGVFSVVCVLLALLGGQRHIP